MKTYLNLNLSHFVTIFKTISHIDFNSYKLFMLFFSIFFFFKIPILFLFSDIFRKIDCSSRNFKVGFINISLNQKYLEEKRDSQT